MIAPMRIDPRLKMLLESVDRIKTKHLEAMQAEIKHYLAEITKFPQPMVQAAAAEYLEKLNAEMKARVDGKPKL